MASRERETQSESPKFEALLSKYIAVWLWSILFGTTTGVLYSFLSFRLERWGGLGMIIAIPAILALLFALMSWGHLYWGLKYFLIPRFIHPCDDKPSAPAAEEPVAIPPPPPPAAPDAAATAVQKPDEPGKKESKTTEDDRGSAEQFGVHLSRSLNLFIAAAAFRAIASILELLLASVNH
jgi:hypothetical protein